MLQNTSQLCNAYYLVNSSQLGNFFQAAAGKCFQPWKGFDRIVSHVVNLSKLGTDVELF